MRSCGQTAGDAIKQAFYTESSQAVRLRQPPTNPASGAYLDPLARLEKIWKLECDLSKPEPSEPASEPLNQPPDRTNGESEQKSEPKFTSLDLTRQQAIDFIQKRRSSRNQTQIIERLWDCKKGGSDAWKRACAQFKDVVGESGK